MKLRQLGFLLSVTLAVTLTACAGKAENPKSSAAETESTETETTTAKSEAKSSDSITIKHAFGETVLDKKPERVASISWGNQDVILALGVTPVGVSEANYGVTDGSGLLPWTRDGFKKLGVENPVLFHDTDGLDYEAISAAQPDVILAAYSGITKEEYDLLSEIAPVVAYPTLAWQTYWRDQIILDATGMGMKEEGEKLVSDLEKQIADKTAEYSQITGKTAAFFYFNPSDLGKFSVYLPTDPRAAYLTDLGLKVPESVISLGKNSKSFSAEISAENADLLKDVDIIIAYGDQNVLTALQADSLLGTIPAVKRGSVVMIPDGTPLAASCTPSALSIPATIDEYLGLIGEAADKVK
ncbi:iron-siderophore ABC transporter substrate-binding protein [Lacrimispora sp. JR3]|uniref:iron-siderophore ABC transporter substrate-binding protein n=1 Tax=Lacrimispora sinapis TaxID=3111456 RepID=UPI003748B06E